VGLMETVARTCATLPDKVGTDCLKPLATMLVGETEDPDPKVREGAISALAAIGTLAKSRGRLAADGWKVVSGMETSLPKIYKRVQALMESGGAPAAATGKGSVLPQIREIGF
jgi:HEAT repeat protein